MKDEFLNITDHHELADYFHLSYSALAKIIYSWSENKYHTFEIPKKNGGKRQIASPIPDLKDIQDKLKDVLYEIYSQKPSAHGFSKHRSIVTNAKCHLNKQYIFNIDISDFFGAIHFGRIKNLFKSPPFMFPHSVSTILAQICCFENALPQGAPTSPILSNMIAWKMDSQLQHLAKVSKCTYTRYVDDISFSFTCKKHRLPKNIVVTHEGGENPGYTLTQIIESNGFKINYDKVRLCNIYSRMEVTGLTVNEFPNVRRQFIRQTSSMLHAWRTFGYESAQYEYNKRYNKKYIYSVRETSFLHVLKGRLAFIRNVRSDKDAIFIKLARQFNELVTDEHKIRPTRYKRPKLTIVDI